MPTVLNQPSALNLHHITLHVRTIFSVLCFCFCRVFPENLNFIFVICFPSQANDVYRIEIKKVTYVIYGSHLWVNKYSELYWWFFSARLDYRTKMIDRCGSRYYTLIYCQVRQRLHFIVNNMPFKVRSYMESEVTGHQWEAWMEQVWKKQWT